MDTTSNNFTWHFDTLAGQGGSSQLNDVVIINDTLAYAVGALYLNDSLGHPDPNQYNLAVWNGIKWTLQKVGIYYNGILLSDNLYTVFAFSKNDLWVGGGGAYHWDGTSWHETGLTNQVFNGRLYRFWGTSSSDLYIVGTNGSIAHYDGSAWTPVQSGTTLDIQDIWGATDSTTGKQTILAVAGNYYISNDRTILQISGTSVTALSDYGTNAALNGVWFSLAKQFWVVGAGIWEKTYSLTQPYWTTRNITGYTTNSIRGTAINDIFVCGAFGDLLHFNGVSWHAYDDQTYLSSGQYEMLAVKGNIVLAVGHEAQSAIVAIGRRS
jgi:hypothetical protein